MQALIGHYLTLRQLHVGSVAANGTLFAQRGFATLGGARWLTGMPFAATCVAPWLRRYWPA